MVSKDEHSVANLSVNNIEDDLDIQEAILKYFFPEDGDFVVNALTRQGAKSQRLSLLSRNRFENSMIPTDNNNILRGVTAPKPMNKEFYENLMMKSNNVITLINSVAMIKRLALKKKKGKSELDIGGRETCSQVCPYNPCFTGTQF